MSKNVIVTGTSSGIGFELVKLFSENNNNILAISRNNNNLRVLDLPGVTSIDLDLTESEHLDLLDKYLKSFKNVDILINNAGHLVNKSFEETTLKDFQDVYSTNVFSVAMLIKKVIKFMNATSNVVNISSIGGVQGSVKFSGLSAYSSSKAALNILTEMLAEEFKERKIHFNSLALGSVETKMLKKAFPDFKASTTAKEMANYIYEFSISGYKFLNGKIVSVNKNGTRKITINSDLNPYRFLITLLHEISHLFVFKIYGFKVKPHGIEWKTQFKNLLLPVLNNHTFPEQILKPLARYTLNPKASTDSDAKLSYALNQFNIEKKKYVSDLKINSRFTATNGRKYVFLKKLRKRYQCVEIQTNKIYLFNPNAEIITNHEKK